MISGIVSWLQTIGTELSAALGDRGVWWGIAIALILGGISVLVGIFALRRTELLDDDCPPSDVFGLGLGAGLITVIAITASIGSSGTSALIPVAVAIVVAVALGKGKKRAGTRSHDGSRRRIWVVTAIISAVFVVAVGFLNGTTVAPSERAGVQPTPNLDYVYWPSLSVGLAQTGSENQWFASGFDTIPAVSSRSWYHWGELWLAALPAEVAGVSPPVARNYVTIPLLLLAICALAGSLARRLAAGGRGAYAYGAVGVLLLAPVPITHMETFGATRPLLYQINNYGAASLAVLLAANLLVRLSDRPRRSSGILLAGAMTASIAPLHPVFLIAGAAGCAVTVGAWALTRRKQSRRLPSISREYRQTALVVVAIVAAVVVLGIATGHSVIDSAASQPSSPFSYFWMAIVAQTILGAGLLFSIPVVWFLRRRDAGAAPSMLLGAVAAVALGAIIWGVRAGNYNYQYFFVGSVGVFMFPLVGFAVWSLRDLLRKRNHLKAGAAIGVFFVLQATIGLCAAIWALHWVREDGYVFSTPVIEAVEQQLPQDAKIGYGCAGASPPELNFYIPRLAGVDAATGRRMIPLCDITPDPYFSLAPQAELFGSLAAKPSTEELLDFFSEKGIGYLYADENHPNGLLPPEHLQLVEAAGGAELYRVVP